MFSAVFCQQILRYKFSLAASLCCYRTSSATSSSTCSSSASGSGKWLSHETQRNGKPQNVRESYRIWIWNISYFCRLCRASVWLQRPQLTEFPQRSENW